MKALCGITSPFPPHRIIKAKSQSRPGSCSAIVPQFLLFVEIIYQTCGLHRTGMLGYEMYYQGSKQQEYAIVLPLNHQNIYSKQDMCLEAHLAEQEKMN